MSVATILKYTYEETCEVCEKISEYANKVFEGMISTFEIVGTAKAAQQLAAQGHLEESKALMLQLAVLKSKRND